MVLPVLSVAARRRVVLLAKQHQQTRLMGGGPKPEWTGIDKTVRTYFPEDWMRTLIVPVIGPRPVLSCPVHVVGHCLAFHTARCRALAFLCVSKCETRQCLFL